MGIRIGQELPVAGSVTSGIVQRFSVIGLDGTVVIYVSTSATGDWSFSTDVTPGMKPFKTPTVMVPLIGYGSKDEVLDAIRSWVRANIE